MNENEKPLFEPLDPPPGGLQQLRRRLDRHRRGRRTVGLSLAGATASLIIAAGILLTMLPDDRGGTPDFSHARSMIMIGSPSDEPLSIPADKRHVMAASRVPLASKKVVFYRVDSIAPAPEEDAGASNGI